MDGYDPYANPGTPGSAQQRPPQNSPYQQGQNPAMDMALRQAGNISRGGGAFGFQKPKNVPKTPAPNSPQNTNPALTPQQPIPGTGYTPTTAPYGMDQTNPGVNEQYWDQNQNLWQQKTPGMDSGQEFWHGIQGNYNEASKSLQPKFDTAFDYASERAQGAANNQAAKRGVYGSSAALNNVGNVAANIEAQRAGASTDFAFRNAANQQNATRLYGDLAFGAGKEAQGISADQLNRTNAGFAASQAAQASRRTRTQDAFGNNLSYLQTVLPWASGQYDTAFASDQHNFDAAADARLGASANAAAASGQTFDDFMKGAGQGVDLATAYEAYTKAKGGGGGGIPGPTNAPGAQPYSASPYVY